MRILFSAWPGYGHLLPMVPLLRAAQDAGHEVVVSSGADLAPLVGSLGLDLHRSGLTAGECYARMRPPGPIDELPVPERIAFAARELFGAGAVDRAADLAPLVESWRPDLVVHDTFELGGAAVAVAHDVPHVTHGYGPMLPENALMVAAVGGFVGEHDLPDPGQPAFAAPYLDICPSGLANIERAPWTDVRRLRPSAGEPGGAGTLPSELAAMPHSDTVYVTLGTVVNQAPGVLPAVVAGCRRLPINVVVTTGPDVDAAEVAAGDPAVLARPYLPQAAVLPHCRVVVSHAGAGTMLGALCHGLAQLCLPLGADQPMNAAALVPTGAALALQPQETTSAAVAEAVERLLADPSYAGAAGRLQAEIDRMDRAETVLAGLL